MRIPAFIISTFLFGLSFLPIPGFADVWELDQVDASTDVAPYMDIAVEPFTGVPYVSYYDEANKDLMLARRVGSGGNCGPNNAWKCEVVDSAGDVGKYNSIAVRNKVESTGVLIAYYDATNGSLKEADATCAETCNWAITTVDEGNPAYFIYKGMHTDVTFDGWSGRHIVYQTSGALIDDMVRHAFYMSGGGGNCGNGDWQCTTVDSGDSLGQYASVDTDMTTIPTGKRPSVSYFDAANDKAWFAVWVGSGGNCGEDNAWSCHSIQIDSDQSGKHTSLLVEDDGSPLVAFVNETDESLIYATYVGINGNCGLNTSTFQYAWQCAVIDGEIGTPLDTRGVAMTFDENQKPVIVYRDASAAISPPVLKVARPVSAMPAGTIGNCGPLAGYLHTWRCDIVDAGSPGVEEASAVAVSANEYGELVVAYRELDTTKNENCLKTARDIQSGIFSDGFETNNTQEWSSANP